MFRTALGMGIAFFLLALAAGLFGFGIVSSEAWVLAKIVFFVFLVLSVLTFVGGFFFRTRTACLTAVDPSAALRRGGCSFAF